MATRKFKGGLLCQWKDDLVSLLDVGGDLSIQICTDDFVGDSNGVHNCFSVAGPVRFEDVSF